MNTVGSTVVTSPSAAGTTVGPTLARGLAAYDSLAVYAHVQGALGGTLGITFQVSPNGGTDWYDWARLTDIADGAAGKVYKIVPSLDYKIVEVGTGSIPALTKGTVAPGSFGDQMRIIWTAGTGTSAGATQSFRVEGVFERFR